MSDIFFKILNMSISASWIVMVVLLLRTLLKKAPKWIITLLWGVVGIRLIFPFSFESVLSLIPSAETFSPEMINESKLSIHTGIPIINNALNPIINNSFTPSVGASTNPVQIWIFILTTIWIIGIFTLLVFSAISYWRIRSKVCTAILIRNNVYQGESIASPFVLGLIRPNIYLPFNISKHDSELVIAHEEAHIKRKDHLWKPFGFIILALHWFNPLMWLGYMLLCRDIEIACDERVIKDLTNEQRADYSQALLNCSVNRHMIAACPLAFGEVGIKQRVKGVLNYKKPAFWIMIVAIIASIAVGVCFLTNPKKDDTDDSSAISNVGGVSGPESIASANNLYQFKSDKDKATLSLSTTDNTGAFSYSLLSSYMAYGTYEDDGNYITLKTNDGKTQYIFKKENDTMKFLSSKSSPLPSYSYSSGAKPKTCVPDEAIFKKVEPAFVDAIDSIVFDIDNDGKEENCVLRHGPTSGIFTFTLTVSENGKDGYFNTFHSPEFYNLSFDTQGGLLKLKGMTQDKPPKTENFDIIIERANIVLSSNGQKMEYWGEQGLNSSFAPNK